MRRVQKGFTLVELLIVIVVIAILAAITIVAYNGIQNRANASAVSSDLSTAAKKVALYKVDNNELYPTGANQAALKTALQKIDMKLSTSAYSTSANTNVMYIDGESGSHYALIAVPKGGTPVYISDTSGGVQPYKGTGSAKFPGTSANIAAYLGLTSPVVYNFYTGNDTNSDNGWRAWY